MFMLSSIVVFQVDEICEVAAACRRRTVGPPRKEPGLARFPQIFRVAPSDLVYEQRRQTLAGPSAVNCECAQLRATPKRLQERRRSR